MHSLAATFWQVSLGSCLIVLATVFLAVLLRSVMTGKARLEIGQAPARFREEPVRFFVRLIATVILLTLALVGLYRLVG